jgi:uncharacterized protein (TIGR00369 family)
MRRDGAAIVMPLIELPHTAGCLVCGRENPHGLHLSLHVDTETGIVTADFTPLPQHIGFEGIIHGGVLATVLDEAMVWAATWAGRRFCVCGELNCRFRQSAGVGVPLRVSAQVESLRSRLIETTGTITDSAGTIHTTATGKYVPVPEGRNAQFVSTLVRENSVQEAMSELQRATRA